MGPHRYRIIVSGRLGKFTREVFEDLCVEYDGPNTGLTGQLDQAALFGVLNRLAAFGIELVALSRLDEEPAETGAALAVPPTEGSCLATATRGIEPMTGQGDHMIVSVFVRRLKPGATFQDFIREWEADEGFGVPTRVLNAQSLTDPREIISIGFVAVGAEQVTQWLAAAPASEAVRHERIDTVIESTTLRCMYELRTEHDFSHHPQQIDIGSPPSLLAALISG